MDSPPKLSGETLIVHHIPLVHCQVPGRQCCGSLKRTNPFCQPDLGLTRTTSLPERDVLHREALVYSSLIQTSSSSGGGGGGSSLVSDSSSFTSSNNSEEPPPPPRPKSRDPTGKANVLRHNPFLLDAEDDEGEELGGDEGDNLNGYLEDSSFHLHGNTNAASNKTSSFHLHDLALAAEPFLLHDSLRGVHKTWCTLSGRPGVAEGHEADRSGHNVGALKTAKRLSDCLDLLELDCQGRHGSSGSTLSMDCGEQEWIGSPTEEEEDPLRNGHCSRPCSCCSSSDFALHGQGHRCCCFSFSEPSENADHQMGYVSDSSCNSSDGVLVNFSAIYNKMNNGGPAKPLNLNSEDQSCTSSVCSHSEAGGAFYLDLHTSPTEPRGGTNSSQDANTCSCHSPQAVDANCNSYHLHCDGGSCHTETSDLTSCFQSQARLVVATQNYYKLVTCDLSSQSSPSPAGSSITSCSEEQPKSSPSQPTEYYLFRKPEDQEAVMESKDNEQEQEGGKSGEEVLEPPQNVIEGQLYVNISPPMLTGGGATGRPRSRSYDRNLDRSPPPRLGSLERMLSCPVRLSDSAARASPPPRVTSFAEIARSKRKSASLGGGSPPPKSSTSSSSQEFSPIPEPRHAGESRSLPPMPFGRCYSQSSVDLTPHAGPQDPQPLGVSPGARTKAEGGSSEGRPVVRYSKDQRPTTLPIQPFIFQHQLSKQPKLRPLLSDYVSQMYSRPSGQPARDRGLQREGEDGEEKERNGAKKVAPDSVRPSPLGSYSPVRHGAPSSETCSTCTPSPDKGHSTSQPTRSLSCPLSASLLPVRPSPVPCGIVLPPGNANQTREFRDVVPKEPQQATPPQAPRKEPSSFLPSVSGCNVHRSSLPTLPTSGFSPLGHLEPAQRCGSSEGVRASAANCMGARPPNANHLSPQALKWREYRRKNPLGVDRAVGAPLSGSLDTRRPEGRLTRRNVFDFPASAIHAHSRLNGQSMKQLQNYYSDFFPDYFSLTERPPEEFCLSPDATAESISIDLLQKKGLVKTVNTAVDLIVAHFGTSRDPGVKAKLGNSSVSPNIGHLILKYLCPAMREILQDGLKPYVLDMIIGQRKSVPWSVVEASTQLGPSTRVLHSLYSKVSQYSELTSHSMRFNAFIFGLLNLHSLEFWFNHLYMHEDIVGAHYHPWGFLPLSQGVCQPLFEELLLLLQPLSLLPFDLDLLFEPRLLQKGQEQRRRKEQLCSAGQGLEQSVRSTFQLMRGRGPAPPPREGAELRKEGAETEVRQPGPRVDPNATEAEQGRERSGERRRTGRATEGLRECGGSGKGGIVQRAKGVGGESWWDREEGEREKRKEQQMPEEARQRDRQAGWWYQLMQSSQVYIDNSAEGAKFVKWEKRKKPAGELSGCPAQVSKGQDSGRRQAQPPPREGVVEGAEASQETDARKESSSDLSWSGKGKPSWMGSPPDSVLNELKQSKEKEPEMPGAGVTCGSQEEVTSEGATQGLRWGRLFGAGVRSPSRLQKAERAQKSRLPSGWLSLDRSMLDLVAQTMGAGKRTDLPPQQQALPSTKEQGPAQQPEAQAPKQQALWEVRALCHHIATEPGQLSFNKGDILRVLSRAEPDWLYCAQGDSYGLVPIIYVTLLEGLQGN
nr:PREDICTED: iporin isoform X1 [Lepisosteus oculatus]XP_015218203.1 PREDICTED: iporin isoform X1 [Lepisosteus oculatus]